MFSMENMRSVGAHTQKQPKGTAAGGRVLSPQEQQALVKLLMQQAQAQAEPEPEGSDNEGDEGDESEEEETQEYVPPPAPSPARASRPPAPAGRASREDVVAQAVFALYGANPSTKQITNLLERMSKADYSIPALNTATKTDHGVRVYQIADAIGMNVDDLKQVKQWVEQMNMVKSAFSAWMQQGNRAEHVSEHLKSMLPSVEEEEVSAKASKRADKDRDNVIRGFQKKVDKINEKRDAGSHPNTERLRMDVTGNGRKIEISFV